MGVMKSFYTAGKKGPAGVLGAGLAGKMYASNYGSRLLELVGAEELQRRFASLPATVEKKVLRQAMRAGLNIVLARMRATAPVGKTGPGPHGRLRTLTKILALRRSRKGIGLGIHLPFRDQLGIDPSARGYYPVHLELGYRVFRPRKVNSYGRQVTGVVLGKGWMRAAWDNGIEAAFRVMSEQMADGVVRAWEARQ